MCPTSRSNYMYLEIGCATYVSHIKIKLHVFGERLCRTEVRILICSSVGNDGLLFLLILDVIRVVHHNITD